jgi:hypothetical protein
MVQAALGRSRTIYGRAYSARKNAIAMSSQETLRPWSAPTSRTRRPEKSVPRAKSAICGILSKTAATVRIAPINAEWFSAGVSRDRIMARELRWVDWSFRSRAPRITPRDWRHDRTLVGERRGRLSKRISSGKVLQKSLGAGRRRRTSTSTPGRETSASSPRQSVATAHRFYIFFYAWALPTEADIFHDKNVITRPHGRCNDRPAAAELK